MNIRTAPAPTGFRAVARDWLAENFPASLTGRHEDWVIHQPLYPEGDDWAAWKAAMADKVLAACGGDVDGKRVAVLGVTFKPNTDDMRDAPSLVILPKLQEWGADVHAHDPEGTEQASPLLPGVQFHDDPYSCIEGADALVIITEWERFRALDLERVRATMAGQVVVDLRNIYRAPRMSELGFVYTSVGR